MQIINILSVASIFKTVWSVLLALLILLLMITVHEFGHYIAGKIFKFKINEFAIGFGPALYKKKRKSGELFSIRIFPLGGYCAFEGEDEDNPHPDAFNNKKPYQRIIVLIAGALMNFLMAIILIMISYFTYGQLLLYVGGVEAAPEASPIYSEYSFHEKDIIISSDGKNIYLTSDLMEVIKDKKAGDLIEFTVDRVVSEGVRQRVSIEIMLRSDAMVENLSDTNSLFESLGIAKNEEGTVQIYSVAYKFGFFETIGRVFAYAFSIAGTIFTVLGQLITGKLGISALGGPVSTIVTTSKIAAFGFNSFLEISAFIGVNLAVFNLLPLPALDGSKTVFTVIEWIRKRPVNRKVEGIIHFAGFVFLIGFAVLVDVLKLF
jgi:regulator of sigma E protease